MSSIVKAVISIYRRGEEKTIERYKARISVTEDSTKQGIEKDGVTIRGKSLKSVSMRKPGRTRQEVIQLKSPILLKLGINVGFCEYMIMAKT